MFIEKLPQFTALYKDGFIKKLVQETSFLLASDILNNFDKEVIYNAWLYHKFTEKEVRTLLWDLDIEKRETICSLIKYNNYFNLYKKSNQDNLDRLVITMSLDVNILCFQMFKEFLLKVKPNNDQIELLVNIVKIAKELNCYDKSYKFNTKSEQLYYFLDKPNPNSIFEFEVYIMSGIAGSGKDTFISNHKILSKLPIVSRDIIRQELGFVEGNGKFKGTIEQEEQVNIEERKLIKKYCENKQSFIYNNMNIIKKYRQSFINSIVEYNPFISLFYIETSIQNNIERRIGQIEKERIREMQSRLDFPKERECHHIEYYKN